MGARTDRGRTDGRRDEGQAMPLVAAVVAVAVVALLALVPLSRAATLKARARAAADAAALAGAAEGVVAARAVAEANGAELREWHAEGDEVWVRVEVEDATAVAKARRG